MFSESDPKRLAQIALVVLLIVYVAGHFLIHELRLGGAALIVVVALGVFLAVRTTRRECSMRGPATPSCAKRTREVGATTTRKPASRARTLKSRPSS